MQYHGKMRSRRNIRMHFSADGCLFFTYTGCGYTYVNFYSSLLHAYMKSMLNYLSIDFIRFTNLVRYWSIKLKESTENETI